MLGVPEAQEAKVRTIRFSVSLNEYKRQIWELYGVIVLVAGSLGVLTVALSAAIPSGGELLSIFKFYLQVVGILAAGYPALTVLALITSLSKPDMKPLLEAVRVCTFFLEGTLIEVETGVKSWLPWHSVAKIVLNKDTVVLYFAPQQYIILPNRCFASTEDRDEVIALARAASVAVQGK